MSITKSEHESLNGKDRDTVSYESKFNWFAQREPSFIIIYFKLACHMTIILLKFTFLFFRLLNSNNEK
ncbi:MAG: hypothetical protein LPK00_06340 [Bacillaceae bacterium]|nr:hypothetical protein [Bacillaceae bacterium]